MGANKKHFYYYSHFFITSLIWFLTYTFHFFSLDVFLILSQVLYFFRYCSYRFDTPLTLAAFFMRSGNPQSIDAATELGLLYLKIGDMQRAFQQFGAALAHSPNCVKAILPMAYVMQVRKFIEMTYYHFDNLFLICKRT